VPDLASFQYNPYLVALSIGVATFAAYTAFDTTECATNVRSLKYQVLWIALGGLSLGGGIWSMHFIGMLALHLNIPVGYDVNLTLASLAIASIASGFALFQIAQPVWNRTQWIAGAVIMGGAVAMMHYLGMAAMRIPATMVMNPVIVVLSIGIAIVASGAAQWILRRFDQVSHARELWRWCASLVMGLAVSTMHYTAMRGVQFIPETETIHHLGNALKATRLAEIVGAGTFTLCGMTLLITLSERRRSLQVTLSELQSAQIRLIQAEKLSSIGQLSAGISHEINNPLAFLKGNIGYLKLTLGDLLDVLRFIEDHTDDFPETIAQLFQNSLQEVDWDFVRDDLPKSLQSMENGITRIQGIVKSLEIFTSLNESEIKSINLCARMDDALKLLSPRLEAREDRPEILVERQYEQLPELECFSGEIQQTMFSLLENAIDAIEQRWQTDPDRPGQITITTRVQTKHQAKQQIYLSIVDSGLGFDPKLESKLFELFLRQKHREKVRA
jgi:two-component system NtrC family sensor kinase